MKGVIFNLFQEVVVRKHGEDTWDELLESAGLTGAYTSLGSYPDAQLNGLLTAASQAFGPSPNDMLRWFGREAMPVLAERYPAFFAAHTSVRSFALALNGIIHPEVRKLYPGAETPSFEYDHAPDGALLMGYRSPRRLCALAHGFLEGAAVQFGETVNCEHLSCMLHGDAKCLLRVVVH